LQEKFEEAKAYIESGTDPPWIEEKFIDEEIGELQFFTDNLSIRISDAYVHCGGYCVFCWMVKTGRHLNVLDIF